MPPRSFLPYNANLYIDDIPIEKVETVDIGGDERADFTQATWLESGITYYAKDSNEKWCIFNKALKPPTNNWLKMHGYPMRRRMR